MSLSTWSCKNCSGWRSQSLSNEDSGVTRFLKIKLQICWQWCEFRDYFSESHPHLQWWELLVMWWRVNHHKHSTKQRKPHSTRSWVLPGTSAHTAQPWSGCGSLQELLPSDSLADWTGLLLPGVQDSLWDGHLGNGVKCTAGCLKGVSGNMWDLGVFKSEDQRQEEEGEGCLQRNKHYKYRGKWIKRASWMWTVCWSLCVFGHALIFC